MNEHSAYSSCRNCPCARKAHVQRPEDAEVAVVFDWPTEDNVNKDNWLAGKRGGVSQILSTTLEAAGFDLDEIYFCSAVNCRPNPKKKGQHRRAMEGCRERLVSELKGAGVKKVLCLGPIGFGALLSHKKLIGITKVEGRWHEAYGMHVIGATPPGFALNEPAYYRDFARVVQKFHDQDGLAPWPDVESWVPDNLAELQEAMDWIQEAEFVAVDLETYGFSPVANNVLAAGFAMLDGKNSIVIIVDEALLEKKKTWMLIERLLNSDQDTIFHNAKFDLQFLKVQLEQRGLRYAPQNIHDTMMLSYALDERPMGKFGAHGLETLARRRYDAPDYGIPMGKFLDEWIVAGEYDKRDMRRRLHIYLTLDAYYTARLFPDLWNAALLENECLLDYYENLLMPGTLALAQVELHGCVLDEAMLEKAKKVIAGKAEPLLARIRDAAEDPEFNPNSWKQVEKRVYDDLELDLKVALQAVADQVDEHSISARKEGIRSRGTYTDPARLKSSKTAAPVLRMLARGYPDHAQFLEDICEYRNFTKNAGTYVDGLLARADIDGRIRSSFNIHGTATGRLSSSNPNLQNQPPASHTGIAIRSAFIAPKGYSLIECDYKQLEVRVAAELSGDPVLLELFEKGEDIHGEISQRIYRRPKEEISSYMRMLGKITLFGLLYGRSPDSVATGPEQEDIVARGGRRWGTEEVKEFFDNLLSDWKVYAKWRQDLRQNAYRDGQVQLPVGHIRRFDFIPKHDGGHVGRSGLNTPVQGTAAHFTLWALIRLHEVLPDGAQVVSTVHDSLLIECRDDLLDEVVPLVAYTLEKDTLWKTKVPLKADIDVSKRWNEEEDAEYATVA